MVYSAVRNGRTTVTRCLPLDSSLLSDKRAEEIYEAMDDVETPLFATLALAGIEFLVVVLVIVAYCARKSETWAPPPAAPIVHAGARTLPIRGNVFDNRIVEI